MKKVSFEIDVAFSLILGFNDEQWMFCFLQLPSAFYALENVEIVYLIFQNLPKFTLIDMHEENAKA